MDALQGQPLVAWTIREFKLLTSGVSVDAMRRALVALIAWTTSCLCLFRSQPEEVRQELRVFEDTVCAVQEEVVSLLGRSYTSPHAMAHWRNQDAVIVPTQQQHVVRGVMDSLDGKHLTLAGFWADLSATDGLHMEELVEAVSASSSLYAGQEGMVLVAHLSGLFVRSVAEVYRRQFQHARGPNSSDEEWDVMICGPQTPRGPQGPSASS